LLITTYQEVNDLFRSKTRCDDENVRVDSNIDLPEQHFSTTKKKKKEEERMSVYVRIFFIQ